MGLIWMMKQCQIPARLYIWLRLKNINDMILKFYLGEDGAPKVLELLRRHEIKDNDLWREAGKLKALHNIPLADAFAAATANHLKATLVAGRDADFEGVEVDMMRV